MNYLYTMPRPVTAMRSRMPQLRLDGRGKNLGWRASAYRPKVATKGMR